MSVLARIALLAVAVTAALLAWLGGAPKRPPLAPPTPGVDFTAPDLLIESRRLSALPADLLKMPLLGELLSEDVVFYYAHNPERDGIEGTLRRIAYEHELKLSDRLVEQLLAEPAELALWRGANGAPRHWVLALRRNLLGRLIEPLARIALDDSQLSVAGEIAVDGRPVKLFALSPNGRRSLLFAAAGERMVVISDAGLLLAPPPEAAEEEGGPASPAAALVPERAAAIAELLSGDPGRDPFAARFDLDAPPFAGHRVSARADFLSFGYQAFFPAIEALRLDYNGHEWSARLRADPAALGDPGPLWRALPGQPAACVALPVAWPALAAILRQGAPEVDAEALLASLDGPLGMCWYPPSQLATPLLMARFHDEPAARRAAPALQALFEAVVGASEPQHPDLRFPVQSADADGIARLSRPVSSPYGSEAVSGDASEHFAARRFFPVSMAIADRWVAFSPDAALVDAALGVAAGRYPAAGDGVEESSGLLLRFTPAGLAGMLKSETLAALPREQEPVFHGVAREQLLPRLERLAAHAPVEVALRASPGAGLGWYPLAWRERTR